MAAEYEDIDLTKVDSRHDSGVSDIAELDHNNETRESKLSTESYVFTV